MTLGNAAWGFRETPLEQQLTVTRDMGLSLIELGIGGVPKDRIQVGISDADIDAVKKLFASNSIQLQYASVGNDFSGADEKNSYAGLETMKQKIDIAHKLGVKGIRIFAGFSAAKDVTGKRWDTMIDCLNSAAAYAKRAGIFLAIETHGGVRKTERGFIHSPSVTTDIPSLKRLMNELTPELAFNYDPANIWAANRKPPEEVLSVIYDRTKYIHLKDYRIVEADVVWPVGCGEGVLDWDVVIKSLNRYTGPAFIEYEPTEDVVDGCRRSAAFLKKYL
ncbi:MAG: sugar phosphate isomerase/epimerase [Spirochaetes bacterium]|nr:sugar phosphate isomerase/epimerase [Spirochaetota bacterium]